MVETHRERSARCGEGQHGRCDGFWVTWPDKECLCGCHTGKCKCPSCTGTLQLGLFDE